jgi:hypothetical protein
MRTRALFSAIALASSASPLVAGAAQPGMPVIIVTLPTEQVGSDVPGPQSPSAARQEAAAAYAENRRACLQEADRSDRRDCLEAARADRDRLLEYAAQSSPAR